jgi:hypothetical protein
MRKWFGRGIVLLVVAGAVAALFAGTALAQTEDPEGFGGPGHHHGKGPRLVGQVAEATGLTAEELFAELEAGKTPAEILTENGVDPDVFMADLLAEMQTRLDEAVANGDIDQTRADEILANANERVTESMNRIFDLEGEHPFRPRRGVRDFIGQAIEATGLTPEEFHTELEAGKTPAEVLSENGVDVDSFVDGLLADLEANLDDAVANGRMEQATADEILANAPEHIDDVLNGTFEFDGEGGMGGPRGGHPGDGQGMFGGRGPRGGFFGQGPLGEPSAEPEGTSL